MTTPIESVSEKLFRFLQSSESTTLGVESMSPEQQQVLYNLLLRMFSLGQHPTSSVFEIHEFDQLDDDDDQDEDDLEDDGREVFSVDRTDECSVVELLDDSAWRVEPHEAYSLSSWHGDDVVIIDDRMYRLDELESVPVERIR